jgi:hypothetical protein
MCDGDENLNIDPVGALSRYCPVQAQSTASEYKCSFFTMSTIPVPTGDLTSSLLLTTSAPIIVIGSSTFTENTQGQLVIGSMTLSQGVTLTVGDTFVYLPSLTPTPSGDNGGQKLSKSVTTPFKDEATTVVTGGHTLVEGIVTSTLPTTQSTNAITSPAPPATTFSSSSKPASLSRGAKAGIGIAAAAAAGCLVLSFYIASIAILRRRRSKRKETNEERLPLELGPGLLPEMDATSKPTELPA